MKNWKRIVQLVMLTLLFVSNAAGIKMGRQGYFGTAEVELSGGENGILLEKNKLFNLAVLNGNFVFTVFGADGSNAIQLNAVAEKGKQALAFQLERVHEQAQGLDGYLATLYVNGKRVAEFQNSPLAIKDDGAELLPGQALKSKISEIKEFPRLITGEDLRNSSGKQPIRSWQPDTVNSVLLETDGLIMNVAKNGGKGNPMLGVFNKADNSLLLTGGGLSWELQYVNPDGTSRYITPDDFEYAPVKIVKKGTGYTVDVSWKNEKFSVDSRWIIDGNRIESFLVVNVLQNDILENILFPVVQVKKLAGNDKIVVPSFSGVEVQNPTGNYSFRRPWPSGYCNMQFTAMYNEAGNGVYIGREDASGQIKQTVFSGSGGLLDVSWMVAVPRGKKQIVLPGKGVVETFEGDWFEAGQIYKRFVQTAPWWIKEIPRKDTPEWFMKNPLWFWGLDINADTTVKTLKEMREFYDLPFGLETGMLYNFKKIWRIGPDYQYKDGFLDYLKDIQALGVAVGPYFNCRLCFAGKTADEENNYSNTGKFYVVKDKNGKPRQENYGAKLGIHSVMCPASSDWQKQLYGNIERLAKGGVDFIYHDQLPCSTPYACYDAGHAHDINDPEGWFVKGHWQTYGKVMGELRAKYPNLAHTGEDASEATMHLIDGFMVWRFGKPGHVPLFQSIFAPRIQFVGRGGDNHGVSGSYESFFPKYGEQLVYNEQIGWTAIEDIRYPSPRRNYLKKLAHLRKGAVDFLIGAEMMKPLKFRNKLEMMRCRWGVDEIKTVTTPKVLHGVWRNVDGRVMIIFLNTVNAKQTIRPLIGFPFGSLTVLRENGITAERFGKIVPGEVVLEPYGVEFWIFDAKADDSDVAKLKKTLAYTAKIMDGERGTLIQQRIDPKQLSKFELIQARKTPLYAKDAQWMLFAYRANGKAFNSDPRSIDAYLRNNWIAARDGSVISYGGTFVGDDAEGIWIEIAADRPGAKIQFFDIGKDSTDQVLAEVIPEPGEWFEFKKYKVKWLKKPSARPWMVIRVSGGDCNIGAWQAWGKGDK